MKIRNLVLSAAIAGGVLATQFGGVASAQAAGSANGGVWKTTNGGGNWSLQETAAGQFASPAGEEAGLLVPAVLRVRCASKYC